MSLTQDCIKSKTLKQCARKVMNLTIMKPHFLFLLIGEIPSCYSSYILSLSTFARLLCTKIMISLANFQFPILVFGSNFLFPTNSQNSAVILIESQKTP